MDRSVTLSAKAMLVAAVVGLALVIAYLLGNAGGPAQAAPSATTDAAHPPTLITTGTGTGVGVPDQLSFSLSVGLTRGDLRTALADASSTTNRVLAALTRVGVRRADVQTAGLSMYPVYDYPAQGPPVLRGYHVSQRAQVLVPDLARGGRAVSAAVAAGGNDVRVDNIGLRIGDRESLLAQARKAAVAEASAKAEEYAASAGQTLGRVLRLREVHASSPTLPAPVLRGQADGLAALPIRAGRDKLAVTVRIVWQIG